MPRSPNSAQHAHHQAQPDFPLFARASREGGQEGADKKKKKSPANRFVHPNPPWVEFAVSVVRRLRARQSSSPHIYCTGVSMDALSWIFDFELI
jgi:hypothetical protein